MGRIRGAARALLVGVLGAVATAGAGVTSAAVPLGQASTPVRMALGSDGRIGAWLVAGPVDHPRAPEARALDRRERSDDTPNDSAGAPALDAPLEDATGAPRWRLASAADGTVDIATAIDCHTRDRYAYAGGILHVERAGRHVFLVGTDDGVSIVVDGRRVFSRDDVRGERDDEDAAPFDLAAGDHTVLFVLHKRGITGWKLRARLLDDALRPPQGSAWLLPGASLDDARGLAARMSLLTLDRGLASDAYRPTLTVRFPAGAPRGVHLTVRVQLVRAARGQDTAPPPLVDADAGEASFDDRSARDLTIALPRVAPDEVEDDDWTFHVDVAGRGLDLPFHPRRSVREAIARAGRALVSVAAVAPWSVASVEHLRDRLAAYVAKGDADVDAQVEDARELDDLSAALEQGRDPYEPSRGAAGADASSWRTGVMRRAYRSPVDGRLSEFGLYVPPDFDPTKKYPLVVALHGMNGRPVEMLMWLFGHDDPNRDGYWEDRHPLHDLPSLQAIAVAPDGHYNAMYRYLGEDDIMRVVDWAIATYPVDPLRVSITGPSMGGIGTAACALHHPDRFAAAEPLCGYHSFFIRGDVDARGLRPWEKFLGEERSNVFWAENGQYLPMYIVHGTKDLPEENSGVLIDRYEELKYDVKHEHPELGHNVWQSTYEDLKGARWLLGHRRPGHPRALRFKTSSPRWGDDAWLHVRELSSSDAWGEVWARIGQDNTVHVVTHAVRAISLDRDTERIDDALPVVLDIDGDRLTFPAGEPIDAHRDGRWRAGAAHHDGPFKHGNVAGPIRDVFHEPLLFVWGADDPMQAAANEDVARAWAHVHPGVHVDYPVMSDAEFATHGEALANDHALFLVGNAKSNRLVRALEDDFPIRVDDRGVLLGSRRIAPKDDPTRSQLGVVFVRPNPRRPDRYVVVVEGVGPLGTLRSLSLPEMLPDYAVYDEDVEPAHALLILGSGTLRAAGFFGQDWSLPP
ncbi:MAG TPA: alpha/beta hydrolase-fold protein [Polyangiaceae bacterium]|nr:alpha/beta hydrolase-fold protein [Polyangiaceae bacterium]